MVVVSITYIYVRHLSNIFVSEVSYMNQTENIERVKIGNTSITISDKYAARAPEEVDKILRIIARKAQPELSKKGYYHL